MTQRGQFRATFDTVVGETADGRVAIGTFYGSRTMRERRRRVLIDSDLWSEPSLDDPCTALCVIDRAP